MKKIIAIVAQVFFYMFSISCVFVLIFSVLSFVEKYIGFDMPFVTILDATDTFDAQINIPFIKAVFKYSFTYSIVLMWLWLLFYSIYFYVLKEFFKVFTNNHLFNITSLKKLITFFRLNFIPLVLNSVIVLWILFKQDNESIEEEIMMIIFHSCVAVIVYLYIDVFKKGKELQDENDLMI